MLFDNVFVDVNWEGDGNGSSIVCFWGSGAVDDCLEVDAEEEGGFTPFGLLLKRGKFL